MTTQSSDEVGKGKCQMKHQSRSSCIYNYLYFLCATAFSKHETSSAFNKDETSSWVISTTVKQRSLLISPRDSIEAPKPSDASISSVKLYDRQTSLTRLCVLKIVQKFLKPSYFPMLPPHITHVVVNWASLFYTFNASHTMSQAHNCIIFNTFVKHTLA